MEGDRGQKVGRPSGVGTEVRMHSRETGELFLLGIDAGVATREAL